MAERRLNARAGVVEEELAPEEQKPPYSYASLIRLAIVNSEGHRATLADIYRWIQVRGDSQLRGPQGHSG